MTDTTASPADPDTEGMALSGLRRLVLHARDLLDQTASTPAYGWDGKQVRAHVAHVLAQNVLTLVADCLPATDGSTADEADA